MDDTTARQAPTVPLAAGPTRERAMGIVKRYAWFCGGTGVLPLPFLDQVVIGGLLAKMLHDICGVYGVQWSDHKIKLIAGAVLGGAHSQWIPRYVLGAFQLHQGALLTGMLAARPATAGAIAYALGTWFVTHFESGAWNDGQGPFAIHEPASPAAAAA